MYKSPQIHLEHDTPFPNRIRPGDAVPTIQRRNTIEQRKKEFFKRENENRELMVTGFGNALGLSQDLVTVKRNGNVIFQQHADSLSHILISGKGITISSSLIEYCLENNIPIDFFGNGNRHCGSILSNRIIEGSLWNRQASCSLQRRNELARTIIAAKVKNQFHLVKYFHKYHGKKQAGLTEAFNEMERFFKTFNIFVKSRITDDETYILILMSQEAQAALRYWNYIRILLSDDKAGFEGREKRGADDVVNSMLNYGYAILYSRVWQALLKAKLNPFDSVIHAVQPGKPTFVYDVVEIFRPQAVDRVVIGMVQKGFSLSVSQGMLEEETKRQLAKYVLERLNRFEGYRGERIPLDNIIIHQAKEIASYFNEEKQSFKPYISKW